MSSIADLQGLCLEKAVCSISELSEKTNAASLVECFGRMHRGQIVSSLAKSEDYKSFYKELIEDVSLIIKHNLENIKNNKNLKALPPGKKYSWQKKNSFLSSLTTSNSEKAAQALLLFFRSSAMPIELAQTLTFYEAPFFLNFFQNYHKKISAAAQKALLEGSQTEKLPINDESLFIRHAAYIAPSQAFSYAEILKAEAFAICDHFKLMNLLDFSKSSLSKTNEPKGIKQVLKELTLGRLEELSLPEELQETVGGVCESEDDRRLICYYIYFLEQLFKDQACEEKTFFNLTLKNENISHLSKAFIFLKRLKIHHDNLVPMLKVLLAACFLKWNGRTALPEKEFNEILSWIYKTSDKIEFEHFLNLCLHLYQLAPFSLYQQMQKDLLKADAEEHSSLLICLKELVRLSINPEDQVSKGFSLIKAQQSRCENDATKCWLHLFYDITRFLRYTPLTPAAKEMLLERLRNCSSEERILFHEELSLFQRKIQKYGGKTSLEKRANYFKAILENNLHEAPPNNFEEENLLLQELPNKIEQATRIKLPFATYINLLLYSGFFYPRILDMIDKIHKLRKKIEDQQELFFISQQYIKKREKLIYRFLNHHHLFPIKIVLGNEDAKLLEKFEPLIPILEQSLLPAPVYAEPIADALEDFVYQKAIPEKIFLFSEEVPQGFSYSFSFAETESAIDLTFTLFYPLSQEGPSCRIPLGFSREQLRKKTPILDLAKAMILDICQESKEIFIENKRSDIDEMQACTKLSSKVAGAFALCSFKEGLAVLNFVKKFKIMVRKMHLATYNQ